jgi:NifB/MoaA-like Fe-S oxidoreductase
MALIKSGAVWVEAINASASQAFTLDFTQSNVLVMCYPNQVNSPSGFGDYGNATMFISSYVQSGKTITTSGYPGCLALGNISSVTFTLDATNASVRAVGLVLAN